MPRPLLPDAAGPGGLPRPCESGRGKGIANALSPSHQGMTRLANRDRRVTRCPAWHLWGTAQCLQVLLLAPNSAGCGGAFWEPTLGHEWTLACHHTRASSHWHCACRSPPGPATRQALGPVATPAARTLRPGPRPSLGQSWVAVATSMALHTVQGRRELSGGLRQILRCSQKPQALKVPAKAPRPLVCPWEETAGRGPVQHGKAVGGAAPDS